VDAEERGVRAVKVVAVFGGGGAKAAAHVGAQRALVEAGLAPTHYVATSFGAVIAAALAAGTSDAALTAQLLAPARNIAAIDPIAILKGVFADHLIKPEPLRALIARLVPATRFDQLKTPLTVTATDLDSGAMVLFGAGHDAATALHDVLYATCALPVYFPAAVIDGRRLADGGLRAVLPLEPAQAIPADLVVAVHVGPGFDEPPLTSTRPPRFPPALVRAHGSSERILMAAQVEQAIADWPTGAARLVVVRAVKEREATFAVGNAKRYIEAGYEETKKAIRLSAC
jgi:NTE family protein